MQSPVRISVFLCDGYSLADVAIALRGLGVGGGATCAVVCRFHALDPSPIPADCPGLTPSRLEPASSVDILDLAVLALPVAGVPDVASAIDELRAAGVTWRALMVLGNADTSGLIPPVFSGEPGQAAIAALRTFKLPTADRARLDGEDAFELLGVDPASLPKVVRSALMLMAEHLDEPLAIDALASSMKVSPRQLHRRFTDSMREAPQAIYRRMRVEVGRRLLESTTTPITTIAHACGFADGPHFARSFQTLHGSPPQAYRRTALRNVESQVGAGLRLTIVGVENHTYKCLSSLEEFSRRVRARSRGLIDLRIQSHRDVGIRPSQIVDAVAAGRIDAAMVVPEMCGNDPHFAGLLPQALLATAASNRMLDKVQAPVFERGLHARRLAMLAPFADYEYQHFWFFSRRPLTALRDLRGRRLGHWSALGCAAFERLGVGARPVSYASIQDAFNADEIDVALGLPRLAVSERLTKVAPYATPAMAVTRHYPNVLVAREATVGAIPRHVLAILREVGESMRTETDLHWQAGLEDQLSLSRLERDGMTLLGRLPQSELDDVQDCMVDAWVQHCASLSAISRQNCSDIRRAALH